MTPLLTRLRFFFSLSVKQFDVSISHSITIESLVKTLGMYAYSGRVLHLYSGSTWVHEPFRARWKMKKKRDSVAPYIFSIWMKGKCPIYPPLHPPIVHEYKSKGFDRWTIHVVNCSYTYSVGPIIGIGGISVSGKFCLIADNGRPIFFFLQESYLLLLAMILLICPKKQTFLKPPFLFRLISTEIWPSLTSKCCLRHPTFTNGLGEPFYVSLV